MEVKRVSMVLADISGYTRFVKEHRVSQLHAEQIITELLETVIDSSEHPLSVSKIEGDAVFLYAVADNDQAAATREVLRQVLGIFTAFQTKQHALVVQRLCTCSACRNVGQLQLKAIVHHGEAAFKRVKQFEELAGRDVILAHRLLKNSVTAKEYLMMSPSFYQWSGGLAGQTPETRHEEYEDMGTVEVKVYYSLADAAPTPLPPRANLVAKLGQLGRINAHMLLRLLGLKPERAATQFAS